MEPLAPWQLFTIPDEIFPIRKKIAIQDNFLTSATFMAFNNNQPQDHLSIYTDGSTCTVVAVSFFTCS